MFISSAFLYVSLFVSLFFEIFLLITYFEIKEEIEFENRNFNGNIKNIPSVTIIVPCHNEENTVTATIQSILNLDYPKEKLDLLVVDDGSTDKTREVVDRSFGQNGQVQIFSKENGGKYTALNFALEKVRSELVGCLDADSFVESSALKRIVPYFDDEKTMAVTPSIRIHEPKTVLQHIQKVEYSWGIFFRRMLASMNALYVTPGPFSIFRTEVFKKLGGYKHAYHTEDMEMALRLQKNGYKIANSVSAQVYTVGPAKLKHLYNQRVRWSYGFLNNAIDYKEMFFNHKYGNIGLFILPIATFSILATLNAAGNLIWSIVSRASEQIAKYQAVGFDFGIPNFSNFSIKWFALNAGVASWVAIATILLSLTILYLSLKITNGKARWSRGILYYLSIYMFIVPFWLAKATYSTIVRKNISWK